MKIHRIQKFLVGLGVKAFKSTFFLAMLGASFSISIRAKEFVYLGLNNQTISFYERDSTEGSLNISGSLELSDNPFYIARHPQLQILYVGIRGPEHGIAAYEIDPETGALSFINQVKVTSGPVHISLDKTAQTIFSAPYSVAEVTLSGVTEEGTLIDSVQVIETDANPHAIQTGGTGEHLYVITLGTDKIYHYHFDPDSRQITPASPPFVEARAGSGPRLMAVHPSGNFLYVCNERDNTVVSYTVDSLSGFLSEFQRLSSLPEGVTGGALSEIHLTPNNQFLYIANRGHATIAGYKVNQESGELTYIDNFPSDPNIRSFSISSDNKHLYTSSTTEQNLATFSIDETTGELEPLSKLPTESGANILLAVDVSIPVSIKPLGLQFPGQKLRVYQNGKQMYLEANTPSSFTIQVASLTGRLVFEKKLGGKRNYALGLPMAKGVYFLRLKPEKGFQNPHLKKIVWF